MDPQEHEILLSYWRIFVIAARSSDNPEEEIAAWDRGTQFFDKLGSGKAMRFRDACAERRDKAMERKKVWDETPPEVRANLDGLIFGETA